MTDQIRILGVDDSATIRGAFEIILEELGYAIALAGSGAEAVERAKQFRPHLILLDFILPDMRGTDVCRILAEQPDTASIPVILVSAKGAEIQQAYHQIASVRGYLAKPFTPESLTEMIAGVLAAEETAAEEAEAPASAPAELPVLEEPLLVATSDGPVAELEVVEEVEGDADEPAEAPAPVDARRRTALEAMFETLRAGLEGVYVEEADTPRGAAADESKSYTDLAHHVTLQLDQVLRHASQQERFALGSDGTLRSVDDEILDAYRRVCRLVFRAVTVHAIEHQGIKARRPRVLAVAAQDGPLFHTLRGLGQADDCHVVAICRDFRQLRLMARIFGPTHLVVDMSIQRTAREQLQAVRAMPEGRRVDVIGVTQAAGDGNERTRADERATAAALEIDAVVEHGPALVTELRERLFVAPRPARTITTPREAATGLTAAASAA